MLEPTSLKSAPRLPVTVLTAVFSIAATSAWWLGQKPDRLVMDGRVWSEWQLWRSLSCTLLHADVLHLGFNLYWLWVFGSLLERVYGHARTLGIFLLFAAASSLLDFALSHGGVGLSGVVYGLWSLLWVVERRDSRFAKAVDPQTTRLFVGWFFICIGLTVMKVMSVANVAHAGGAIAGALLGWLVVGRGVVRLGSTAGLLLLLGLGTVGATVWWPWVNLTDAARTEIERLALSALDQGNGDRGVQLLERVVRMRQVSARPWYNLGVAYQQVHRYEDAARAFETAARMPTATEEMKKIAVEMRAFVQSRSMVDSATPANE